MGERAACVMLNKGPYVVAAVRILDDILSRMRSHQEKKRSMLRKLHVATAFRSVRCEGWSIGCRGSGPDLSPAWLTTTRNSHLFSSWRAIGPEHALDDALGISSDGRLRYMCGSLGRVTAEGLAASIKAAFSPSVLRGVVLLRLIANTLSIAADDLKDLCAFHFCLCCAV
jgi:hypothetical protein